MRQIKTITFTLLALALTVLFLTLTFVNVANAMTTFQLVETTQKSFTFQFLLTAVLFALLTTFFLANTLFGIQAFINNYKKGVKNKRDQYIIDRLDEHKYNQLQTLLNSNHTLDDKQAAIYKYFKERKLNSESFMKSDKLWGSTPEGFSPMDRMRSNAIAMWFQKENKRSINDLLNNISKED